MCVLVFARPELGHARPGLGTGRNRTSLTLDPLDPASMDALVDALVPGMPAAARAVVTGRAQGLPLFAVETIRALIDRDIVQPSGGEYRLVGEIGQLQVPDSLHALLAARLDALDPAVRQLAADAAVLGATFPAEALIEVSGQDEPAVRAALAELLRREILAVSADPLSPERGSYQFTQDMLRQVAYDTLSRRDRKTRPLQVAEYLRAAFAGDGDEIADVIARHYLDALNAIPGDPDTPQIREQAITALIGAAERAERTGAPARAATSYATAAQLAQDRAVSTQASTPDTRPGEGVLWEKAAEAALTSADWAAALQHAGQAQDYYLQLGDTRAAARAQAAAGNALSLRGRHPEAREQLTVALEALRADPDTDTVRTLMALATVEVHSGSTEVDRLTTEALTLGQALDVNASLLAALFVNRGAYHALADRRPQGVSYLREAARLAEQAGDTARLGWVLLNLSDALAATDFAAAADAARTAAGHLRRVGDRIALAYAIVNLFCALLLLGDWDTAGEVLAEALDSDGLGDIELLTCYSGWLAALRGDADTAEVVLAALRDLTVTEDLQDQATVRIVEAFAAAARGQPAEALRHARAMLAHAEAIGISGESLRWAWPLAARLAHELGDAATSRELLRIARLLPAWATRANAAGRAGSCPGPPRCPRRRPGRRRFPHRSHHQSAQRQYPVSSRSRPARPSPAAPAPGRRRRRCGRYRRSPPHRPPAPMPALLDRAEIIEPARPSTLA